MQNLWWKNAVIYEVYVDKFAGNFKGMTAKIDYLKNLGINCIWLLPHYPSPMIDDGYDVSDYLGVRKELGTLEDFKLFSEESHRKGIKVIIDLVLNHISVEHPWFREAVSSAGSPRKDFFLWSKTGKEFPDSRNPFSHMKPSNWTYDKVSGEYYFTTFYPQQADLNWKNPEVFDEMMGVIDFWIANGVDGFRLDAAPYLIKKEGTDCRNLPETHSVIKKIRSYIDSKYSGIVLLAEANGSAEDVIPYFGQDDECHMAFNFPLMVAFFVALKRGDRAMVNEMIRLSSNIPDNCQWATFLRNHDELTLSHATDDVRDELLNWADPEGRYDFKEGHGISMRLAEIFHNDKDKIMDAFKLLFDSPGAPVIYYGDEIGMDNLKLADKPVDSRLYVRGDFDWREAERQLKDGGSLLSRLSKLVKDR